MPPATLTPTPSLRRSVRLAAVTLALGIAAPAATSVGMPAAAASAGMASMPGMVMPADPAGDASTKGSGAPSARHAGGHHGGARPADTSTHSARAARRSMFRVGTKADPLFDRGPVGPLSPFTPPRAVGYASHGSFAQVTVAAQLARAASLRATGSERAIAYAASASASAGAAGSGAAATRLTTVQATKQLSRACQRLVKAKASKLRKRDVRRRKACIARRTAIITASTTAPASTTATPSAAPTTTPGVSAPAPTIPGPSATPAPSAPGKPGAATPTPTPTPVPAPGPGGIDPSTVQCSAVGVKALDVDPLAPFQLSRAVACPSSSGAVNFELVNNDRQPHGIAYKLRGAADSTAKTIIPESAVPIAGGRASANVALPPGKYTLICTVSTHNPAMQVDFTILSKADFIAQGYAG